MNSTWEAIRKDQNTDCSSTLCFRTDSPENRQGEGYLTAENCCEGLWRQPLRGVEGGGLSLRRVELGSSSSRGVSVSSADPWSWGGRANMDAQETRLCITTSTHHWVQVTPWRGCDLGWESPLQQRKVSYNSAVTSQQYPKHVVPGGVFLAFWTQGTMKPNWSVVTTA